MPSFGNMFASLTLESASFMSGMEAARKSLGVTQKRFEQIGANLQKAGAVMTVGITAPFTALVSAAIPAAIESKQAMAQVNAALESMGPVAGRTADQLSDAAGKLQDLSNFDDDDILKSVTANLLTFGKVIGDVFDRAQLAAVNLSARLGTDLQSSALMLGKALNDPVKGITALTRSGVSFTAAQKEQIKSMVATGDAAGAQRLILSELEKQFGGAAAAARAATPDAALQQQWRTFQEVVGGLALQVLPPFTAALTGIVKAFNELSPQVQTFVVGGAAIAAALGPVTAAIGTMMTVGAPVLAWLSSVAAGGAAAGAGAAAAGAGATAAGAAMAPLAAILIPLAVAVGGVYLAWQNWDKIEPILSGVAAQAKTQTATIDGYLKQLTDNVNAFDQRMGIPSKDEALSSVARYVADTWRTVNQYDLARWAAGVDASIAQSFSSAVASAQRLFAGVKTWLVDNLGPVMTWVSNKAKAVGDAFFTLYDRVVGHSYVPDMVDGIAAQMARLDAVMVSPATKATNAAGAAFRKLADEVRPLLDELFPDARAARDLQDNLRLLERARKAGPTGGGLSDAQYDEARTRLMTGNRGDAAQAVDVIDPAVLTPATDALEQLRQALPDLSGAVKATTAQVAESFAGMAQDVARSIGNFADSLKSKDWLGALQDGLDIVLQLAQSGVFGGGMQSTVRMNLAGARAKGGPVMPNRSYLVGERGPEILRMGGQGGSIVPNDQIGGPMSITVAVEEGALFRPVVRSEAGLVSYQTTSANNRTSALRQRQALA